MKAKVVVLAMVLFTLGCASEKKVKKDVINNEVEVSDGKFAVTLQIEKHVKYCGGAAPSQEMLNRYEPYADTPFYIKGQELKDKFISDSLGVITTRLAAGEYCFKSTLREEKAATISQLKKDEWTWNEDCLNKWFDGCDAAFKVSSDTTFTIVLRTRCSYNGPVPCLKNLPSPPP